MKRIDLQTRIQTEMIDITALVQQAVSEQNVERGICVVFVPHTTAGVTINENADPDVSSDVLRSLEKITPAHATYRHAEGNAPAHVKAVLVGSSQMIPVEKGRLVLGPWQGLFFCEFDGPRSRKIFISTIAENQF